AGRPCEQMEVRVVLAVAHLEGFARRHEHDPPTCAKPGEHQPHHGERVVDMFECMMGNDDVGPAFLYLLYTVENLDAVLARRRRGSLVDLDADPLPDIEAGEYVAAATSKIDHTIRRADKLLELQAIEIGRVALVRER